MLKMMKYASSGKLKMTMQKGICEECEKEYEYEYNPNFPRKYCPECSAIKKAQYENKQLPEEKPVAVKQEEVKPQVQESKHDIVISRTEKPHSYEFGKAGARHKIYYGNVNELQDHIKMLKAEGLIEEEARGEFE